MLSKSALLQARLTAFGASAMIVGARVPRDTTREHVIRQLARSATAPAAMYAEAREAESTRDYAHKLKLCVKELRESAVWLEMLSASIGPHRTLDALRKECEELTAICATCVRKARLSYKKRESERESESDGGS